MLNNIKLTLQIIAIGSFGLLSVIGIIQRDWNFGVGLNFALTILYIFLYLHPIR
jgi:hypothetical protein